MPNQISNVSFNSPDQAQVMEIQRRQALAQALQQQSQEPLKTEMAGGWAIPISPFQGLAKMAQAGVGSMQQNKAQELAKALGTQNQERRTADMSLLAGALQGRKASPGGLTEDAAGNVTQADPMQAQSPVQSLGQALPMMQDPQMQQVGMQALTGAQTRQDTQDFQTKQLLAQQQFQAGQKDEDRASRLMERDLAVQAQIERQRQQQQWQDQQARQGALDRQGLAQMAAGFRQDQRPPVAVMGPDGKPVYVPAGQAAGRQPVNPKFGGQLPASSLKLQNELLEDIGVAGTTQADLGQLIGQLTGGGLELGPVENLISRGRNVMGRSSPNSEAYASFKSTLEKLRNDSLRLNKGVQTEGDAQRAWNEIFANMNDQKVVSNRLQEIQGINQRAADLKRVQIDVLRQNFGLDSMDVTKFSQPQSPLAGGSDGKQPDRRQTPRGSGTRVVNY